MKLGSQPSLPMNIKVKKDLTSGNQMYTTLFL